MKIFGIPVFGVILPFIGFRRIYLNRDGSFFDSGEVDMLDERGPVYVKPLVAEWLGLGLPLSPAVPRDTLTGEPVTFPDRGAG